MKRYYFTYKSDKPGRKEQAEDCIRAYNSFTENMTTPLALRCTFFVDTKNNTEYERDKDLIHRITKDTFFFPAVIGQPPINTGLALECVIIDRNELNAKVHLRSVAGHPYILLEKGGNKSFTLQEFAEV